MTGRLYARRASLPRICSAQSTSGIAGPGWHVRIAFGIPLLGAIFIAAITFYGARYGWHWEWYQALFLAIPGIVLTLIFLAIGGLSSLFTRRAY